MFSLFKIPAEVAKQSIDNALSEWSTCKRVLSETDITTSPCSTAIAAIERWLGRWDPAYAPSGEFPNSVLGTEGLLVSSSEPTNRKTGSKGKEKLTAMELLRSHRQRQNLTTSVVQVHKLHSNHVLVIEALLNLADKLTIMVSRRGNVEGMFYYYCMKLLILIEYHIIHIIWIHSLLIYLLSIDDP